MPSIEAAQRYSFDIAAAREFGGVIAGIDEAGRGPWAGPVVAAAVILPARRAPKGLDDSKALSAARREDLFAEIMEHATVGVGIVDVVTIDRINILQATLRAMTQAYDALGCTAAVALIDGNRPPALACPVRTIVKGDSRSASIAAASIVAKVTRDRLMTDLARQFPAYGFERHKGYGTTEHREALARLGPTRHHRRSFAPIRELLTARD